MPVPHSFIDICDQQIARLQERLAPYKAGTDRNFEAIGSGPLEDNTEEIMEELRQGIQSWKQARAICEG